MAWNDPRDWQANEMLTASLLNTELRDNLNALRNVQTVTRDASYSISTISARTLADIDATNLKLTLTSSGGPILIGWRFTVKVYANSHMSLDFTLNGTNIGGATTMTADTAVGVMQYSTESGTNNTNTYVARTVSGSTLAVDKAAATYTIVPQWAVDDYRSANTSTAEIVGPTANANAVPILFWAKEL